MQFPDFALVLGGLPELTAWSVERKRSHRAFSAEVAGPGRNPAFGAENATK
jgi:hypothetical protein